MERITIDFKEKVIYLEDELIPIKDLIKFINELDLSDYKISGKGVKDINYIPYPVYPSYPTYPNYPHDGNILYSNGTVTTGSITSSDGTGSGNGTSTQLHVNSSSNTYNVDNTSKSYTYSNGRFILCPVD